MKATFLTFDIVLIVFQIPARIKIKINIAIYFLQHGDTYCFLVINKAIEWVDI